jgi:hypothetical protein
MNVITPETNPSNPANRKPSGSLGIALYLRYLAIFFSTWIMGSGLHVMRRISGTLVLPIVLPGCRTMPCS